MQVYGADKVSRQLNREVTAVARCTFERLMREQGVRRGKRVRTTVAYAKSPCSLDLVSRQFKGECPNQLWVSDCTYVSTRQAWVYVASAQPAASSAGASRTTAAPTPASRTWSTMS
jgi:transposase InsO family protein